MKTANGPLIKTAQYISGFADVKLKEAETLDTVFSSLIPNYNVNRFEAVAFRVFLGKENNITLYAIDKMNSNQKNLDDDKLPVKKFKLKIAMTDLIKLFSNINFTISKDNFDIKDIEVMNK
jgi:hypothetical protein